MSLESGALPVASGDTLPNWNDYALVCSKRTLTILEQAEREAQYPLASEHVWTFVDSMSDTLTAVALEICLVVLDVIFSGTSFCKYQWKRSLYYLSAALTVDPLIVLGTLVSRIMRAASSLIGIISPAYALSGWRLAEVCDIALLELKKGLFTLISPDCSEAPPYSEIPLYEDEPIRPSNALSYLQTARCTALYGHTIPVATITKLDQMLKKAIADFIAAIRDKDMIKLVEATHFQEIKTGTFQGSEELKAILQRLFASATTPSNLPEKIQRGELNVQEAHLLYRHIKGQLFVPRAVDAPPEPADAPNAQIIQKAIERLLLERFSFGTVSYRF